MAKNSSPIEYSLLWNWWDNASLNARKDMISQLTANNWLKNLPPKEQLALFLYSPEEIKSYMPKWDVIHPQTLRLMKLQPQSRNSKLDSLMIKIK
jgi:hypothetical protein